MAIFFTSDTHAFHKNISGPKVSQWDKGYRDFNDEYEMTKHIVKVFNQTLKYDDILYHLGDWSFGGKGNIYNFRKQINCQNIHLIYGNHDQHIKNNKLVPYENGVDKHARKAFYSCQDVLDIKIGKTNFFLSHYAHRIWLGSHKGIIHLYGHSHDSIPEYGKSMDVGIDSAKKLLGEYRPFKLEEILDHMKNKTVVFPDHHDEKTNWR